MRGKHPETMVMRQPWDTGSSAKDDPYTELAVEILMVSVEDYIEVLKTLLRGDLSDSEIHDCKLVKKRLEKFFRSKEYEFYAAFLSTEIDPEILIQQCGLRAKERLEAELEKEREKEEEVKKEKEEKEAAEMAAEEQAEKQEQEQMQEQNTNNISTADKAESEEAQ